MPGPSPCVLVVEDDADQRTTLQFLLEDEGYTVVTAADGQEALLRARERPPALILLDLQLPDMHGLETFAQLKQLPHPVPVVFMTAEFGARREAAAHGASGYLEKPFTIDAILQLVARFCD